MNKKYIISAVIIIVIVGLGVWFSSYDPKVSGTPSVTDDQAVTVLTTGPSVRPPVDPNEIADLGMGIEQTSAPAKEFTVTGSNFAFAPATLSVKKGDTVKITFVNSGGTHDLKIDEFNAATAKIGAGKQATITFIADKAGSFEYYCSVGSHRAMGMKGTLTVQ